MLWLIMSFIPDEWIKLAIHAMVLFGIAVYFGSGLVRFLTKRWLTSLPQLMLLIKILGISLFITGVFFEGGYGVEMEWRAKVAEMQLKVAKAEADSAQANLKIIEVQQQKQQEIQSITASIQSQIKAQKTVINSTCKLDPMAIDLYNMAVTGKKSGDKK